MGAFVKAQGRCNNNSAAGTRPAAQLLGLVVWCRLSCLPCGGIQSLMGAWTGFVRARAEYCCSIRLQLAPSSACCQTIVK